MADKVIIDEQALIATKNAINTYLESFMEYLDNAIASIEKNHASWDDEDFDDLINMVDEVKNRFLQIDGEARVLVTRIDNKIEAIQSLRRLKI